MQAWRTTATLHAAVRSRHTVTAGQACDRRSSRAACRAPSSAACRPAGGVRRDARRRSAMRTISACRGPSCAASTRRGSISAQSVGPCRFATSASSSAALLRTAQPAPVRPTAAPASRAVGVEGRIEQQSLWRC